jgi:hypothetical protein
MQDLSPVQSKALQQIVRLARENTILPETIHAALESANISDNNATNKKLSGAFLAGVLGYLGGALMFSGLFIFAAIMWEDMNSPARVIISLGVGLACFIAGLITHRDEDTRKSSLPLWLVSAILIPTGLFVTLHEYAQGDDPILGAVIVFGITSAIYAAGFIKTSRESLLFFALFFGFAFIGSLYEHLEINRPLMWLATAAPFAVVTWRILYGEHREISPLPVLITFCTVISCIYYYVGNTPLDGVMTALLLGGIILGQRAGSRTLLMLSTLVFLTHFIKQYGFCAGYREDMILKLTAATTGVSMMLMAGWMKDNISARFGSLWNFFGSSLLFAAFGGLWMNTSFDILFPAIPAFILYLSLQLQSRALLLSSILALLSFISYYTAEYFADVVGWPLALMAMGFALIILCRFALKMSAQMKNKAGAA